MSGTIEIGATLTIPLAELSFVASRSSGPGGQHVNKTSSRITLLFDVAGSPSLDDDQRRRILRRLETRIGRDGVLQLHAQRHRSQARNREEAIERFIELLRHALARRRKRVGTRPSGGSVERRLTSKRRRSNVKRHRGKASDD